MRGKTLGEGMPSFNAYAACTPRKDLGESPYERRVLMQNIQILVYTLYQGYNPIDS